jgi:hypothetical protein
VRIPVFPSETTSETTSELPGIRALNRFRMQNLPGEKPRFLTPFDDRIQFRAGSRSCRPKSEFGFAAANAVRGHTRVEDGIMNVKRTTAPWLETVVTAALLYGVATQADAQADAQADVQAGVSSGVNLQSRAVHALTTERPVYVQRQIQTCQWGEDSK